MYVAVALVLCLAYLVYNHLNNKKNKLDIEQLTMADVIQQKDGKLNISEDVNEEDSLLKIID
jgi:hypothetical protein